MSLLVGFLNFLALAIFVPIMLRIRHQRNAIGMIVAAAIVIHLVGTAAGAAVLAELDYWQSASVFGFATVILVYAYGTCYRSLSVQMLLAISRSTHRTIDVESLYRENFERFVRERIDALVEGDRAEFRNGQFAITPSGRSSAETILRARRLFGLKESRLYFGKSNPGIGS